MKPKKIVYHVGDKVIVENPLVVRRVGYPLGINEGVAHILKNHETALRSLFQDVVGHEWWDMTENSREFDEVVKKLAYAWIKSQGFGGAKREIHAVEVPELKGRICGVILKKVVQTGTRDGGYGGGEDGEPPTLRMIKSHVLLGLDLPFTFGDNFPYIDLTPIVGTFECWVDSCNVRKVESK